MATVLSSSSYMAVEGLRLAAPASSYAPSGKSLLEAMSGHSAYDLIGLQSTLSDVQVERQRERCAKSLLESDERGARSLANVPPADKVDAERGGNNAFDSVGVSRDLVNLLTALLRTRSTQEGWE